MPIAWGQTALATITGTITDATGAVVASAPVTVRNLENGQVFTASSSETGNYSVLQLPIGDYDLTIAVSGFKTYTHTSFHLAAAQIMREDVKLDIGNISESVTVTAEASLLKTETTTVTQNVTLAQLNNLPVLGVGTTGSGFRDPFSSVRLTAGIQYNNGANGAPVVATNMVVNGTPANTYGTRLDGMTMNPTGSRLLANQMQTQPSTDAIEEVAIMTSNFAAEYGAAGGAMINMITKSGTNAFHGSLYDYGTNEALYAHQPYVGLRPKIRQNDMGGTFGGPVRIPKVYNGSNKTFFFFSMEMFKQFNMLNGSVSVPTAAYRAGDFSALIPAENRLVTTASGVYLDPLGRNIPSGTIFDPATQRAVGNFQVRDAFAGNKIPVARFDPIALKVLSYVPLPSGSNFDKGLATGNYIGEWNADRTSKIPSIKIDQNVGSASRVSFYLQETNTRSPRSPSGADAMPDQITGGIRTFSSGTTVRLNLDHNLSSRLLLHLGVGWNDSDFRLDAPVPNFNALQTLGLKGATQEGLFPRIITAINGNNQIGGMTSIGAFQPTASFERRPSATGSLNYVIGGHTYKLGFDYRLEKYPQYFYTNVNGTYTFGQNMTQQPSLLGASTNQGFNGFEIASFMLGGMSANSLSAPIALGTQKSQSALYLQDTWKLTRKLTLDYGLRWDLGTYTKEQYGRNGSIGLNIPNPSAAGRLGATQYESLCKCTFASNYPYAIGPRLGLAYQIDNKTVLRAGWGVVYNSTATAAGSAASSASSSALPTNSGLTTGLFQNGMPSDIIAVWPSFNPASGQSPGQVVAMSQNSLLDPNAGRPARLIQWSVGLQREVNRNLVVEASYVGNRGVWWSAPGLATLNQLSAKTLTQYGFNDLTSQTEANLMTAVISNLTAAQRSTLASRGVTGLPYSNFPGTQNVRQSLLDYPQFTGNGLTASPLGNTWYDSLQINATQRFSHGLSFNANYTWAKNLDTITTISDVYNRGLSKNISANDIPHTLRITAQYTVPQLNKSGLSFLSNRFVSYALSDWGLGIYAQYQSASLLTTGTAGVYRPTSNGTVPLSQFLGRGPGGAQLKKDADGNYMSPWSVDWTDYSGTHHTDPIDINCHCYDPTKNQVLNPAAWENIPNGQWGADQSTLRFFRGIRQPTENANFSRNFRLKEKIQLNVRVEFNNVFNRTRLPNPSIAGNFNSTPTKFTSGASAGLYSGGFGTYNVLSGLTGQRNGTFVARLTF